MAKSFSQSKGFVAFYPRRLPTLTERVNTLSLQFVGKAVLKQNATLHWFLGTPIPHYRCLPLQWGIPNC